MINKEEGCDELLNPEKTLERLANPEPQKGETEETDGEPPKKKNSLIVKTAVLVALGEDYYTFDEMSGIWQVVRVLLYITWGFLLATRTRRDKAKGAEYVAFGVACVAALNLLIPIWSFQIAFYAFVAGVPGLYFMVFILTGMLGGYIWGPVDKTDRK